ncbi:hypothetical protein ASPWEDRAFT_35955 [Aspergillus wentii DTO 134E9]|uniref:Probable beta-glucosidase E n=1 Tax=Aspergillus wentii DTO 134E9 TaxID=1073089 RepID=A0A1L9RTQ9_ASPWE|nr:uncharacterized protein ASPWEDRAFT_35955 [Aspergillus wentii DTO 134E9]KAI9933977.1 hypothetical protein MW887_005049 [Aspergillus wentii]OJJ38341.1 hypothetical protein ASPWEDRAFT_35955 [Aspergillus wentii DTO 134E9]
MPPTAPGSFRDHLKSDDGSSTRKSSGKRYAPLQESIPEEERNTYDDDSDSYSSDETIKLRRVDPRGAGSAANNSAAYVPAVPDDGNIESYLDSIAEAELELLSASKHDFDVEDDDDFDSESEGYTRRRRRERRRSYLERDRLKGWRGYRSSRYFCPALVAVSMGLILLVIGFLGMARYRSTKKPKYHMVDSASWFPTPRGGSLQHWADSYGKARHMVENMTLIEKINITTGTGWQMGLCVGNTGSAEHVKFPSLCLQDGPQGLRYADHITAFPAGITTGATWNRTLIRERGNALGREARLKGVNVLLGPSIGALGMNPAGGRNWESFGSDPVLQGIAAAETIRGIQSNGVMATAKHYVMNEQEHFRKPYEWGLESALSSNIDDRSLHEVFVWPFAESIRADVASIMCAYQMVNNSYSCENSKLLNGLLKDELGFQGFVQSDWQAQRSGVNSALGGLDMSMPGDGLRWANGVSLWGGELTKAVLNTTIPIERLNDMVSRIVAAWYQLGQDKWEEKVPNFSSWTNDQIGWWHHGSDKNENSTYGEVNRYINAQGSGDQDHSVTARRVAAEGTVLLKNVDDVLPLSRKGSKPGGVYRVGVYGDDASPAGGPNSCPDKGCNAGTLASGWGSGTVEFPYLVSPVDALAEAWEGENVEFSPYLRNGVMPVDAEDKDLCLVFANADSGEGYISEGGNHGDRQHLFLQKGGDSLIKTVASHCGNGNGKTVVVIHAVGPVVMEPWIDLPGVDAVVLANLPGQESGHALVDVLFGDVDASGRLPYTIGKCIEDYGPSAQVLYEPNAPVPQVDFKEGLYIDYRYFDRYNITPRFEFGYGLSYTKFALSGLKISTLRWKSRLPSARPVDPVFPPEYDTTAPNESVLFPPDFNAVNKYIYPYLPTLQGTKPGHYQYYPKDYKLRQAPSPAGGGAGGNPSLYEEIAEVKVTVTNTGARAGQEVVQLYLSFPPNVTEVTHPHKPAKADKNQPAPPPVVEEIEFPVRVLRDFSKVALEPGKRQEVRMALRRKDLSYWSVREQNWVMPDGEFGVWVGRSSRDLALVGSF